MPQTAAPSILAREHIGDALLLQGPTPHPHRAQERDSCPWHLLGYVESTQALFSNNGSYFMRMSCMTARMLLSAQSLRAKITATELHTLIALPPPPQTGPSCSLHSCGAMGGLTVVSLCTCTCPLCKFSPPPNRLPPVLPPPSQGHPWGQEHQTPQ